jgi:hypothetical protein
MRYSCQTESLNQHLLHGRDGTQPLGLSDEAPSLIDKEQVDVERGIPMEGKAVPVANLIWLAVDGESGDAVVS